MLAKFEKVLYTVNAEIWAGKYKNVEILPHWHIGHEIIHCEKGKIFVTLNGQTITLNPGDSVYCYSRDIHSVSSDVGSINSMIVFSPLGLPHNFPSGRLQNPVIRNDALFHSAFDVIYREINELPLYYGELCFSSLCQYLILLMRAHSHAESFKEDAAFRISELKKLIEVLTNSSDYITFKNAAKLMGYSESYFSRYFKNIFGVTFSQYMNAIKTSDAMLLLRGNPDLTITQVAGYCGFNSIRHFNRVFKNLTGSSPSDFASDGFDSSVPSIQLGKYFFPTLSSSIPISYFEDPDANRSPY